MSKHVEVWSMSKMTKHIYEKNKKREKEKERSERRRRRKRKSFRRET